MKVILNGKLITALLNKTKIMDNRKTAMQELLDNLEAIDIKVPIGVKQIFLEKEKEQITDAFYSGHEDRDLFKHGDDYYNKMYEKKWLARYSIFRRS